MTTTTTPLAALVRAHRLNAEQRAKFPDEPLRFMKSEAEIDAALDELSALATEPAAIVRLSDAELQSLVETLIALFGHENSDIAEASVALVAELTDPEIYEDSQESSSSSSSTTTTRKARLRLIDTFMDQGGAQILVDETCDTLSVRSHTLTICSNLCEIYPSAASEHLALKTKLFSRLLTWMETDHGDEAGNNHPEKKRKLVDEASAKKEDEDRLSCAELLSVMLVNSETVCDAFILVSPSSTSREANHAKRLLRGVLEARWSGREPTSLLEWEFLENAFDCLYRLVSYGTGQGRNVFGGGEVDAVEAFCVGFRPPRVLPWAVKALHLLCSDSHARNCERFVECGGLKMLFPLLAKLSASTKPLVPGGGDEEIDEATHTLGLVGALFLGVPRDSIAFQRLSRKFLAPEEKSKLEMFLALRARLYEEYERATAANEERKEEEDDEEEEGETKQERKYLANLELGLEKIQSCDVIVASLLRVSPANDSLRASLPQDSPAAVAAQSVLLEMASFEGNREARARLVDLASELGK